MILGLDTATPATAVALFDPATGVAREERHEPAPGERPRHTTGLMRLVVEQIQSLGAGWADIERIAVGIGPGTFTGLRIGVATAQALARTREVDLVGVSTLHSLALGAAAEAEPGDEAVVAVIDGRRREVFAAGWSLHDVADPQAPPLISPRAVPIQELAETLQEARVRWLATGDGSVAFTAALEGSGARIPKDDSGRNAVSAIDHCRLAAGLPSGSPEGVRPEYLRLPDAEISRRAARQP